MGQLSDKLKEKYISSLGKKKNQITIFIFRVYKLGFQKQIIYNLLCLSYRDIERRKKN